MHLVLNNLIFMISEALASKQKVVLCELKEKQLKNVFREVEHSYIPLPLTPSLSLYYLVSLAPGIELPLPCRAPQH